MAWTSAEDQKLLSYLSTSIMAMAGHDQIPGPSTDSIQQMGTHILAPSLHVDDVEKVLQLEPLGGQVFDHGLTPTLHVDDVRKALQIEPLIGPVNVPEFSPPLHGEKPTQTVLPLGSGVYDTESGGPKPPADSMPTPDLKVGEIDGEKLASPLHVQKIERAIGLQPLVSYISDLLRREKPVFWDSDADDDDEYDLNIVDSDTTSQFESSTEADGIKILHGIKVTKAERRADKSRLYNFNRLRKNRKWLKNVLLSDSSSDEYDDMTAHITDEYLRQMKKMHNFYKRHKSRFRMLKENRQYKYYSSSLLSAVDHFADHQKSVVGVKKFKATKEQRRERKKLSKLRKLKREYGDDEDNVDVDDESLFYGKKGKRLSPEQAKTKQKLIWADVCATVAKACKQRATARKEVLTNLKKVSTQCIKEARRLALEAERLLRTSMARKRRISRGVLVKWHRYVRSRKETRVKEERETTERRIIELNVIEARHRQRKLNFLITQTELYAHLMVCKKLNDDDEVEKILKHLDEFTSPEEVKDTQGRVISIQDLYDFEAVKVLTVKNAKIALSSHQNKIKTFDGKKSPRSLSSGHEDISSEHSQPDFLMGLLKGYQLNGVNWLCNLYEMGINGVLADGIGLDKTIQTLAFLAHLAEVKNIWGPFLIVASTSAHNNWTQQCARFLPNMKCFPYWGSQQDRKILRKFWNYTNIHSSTATFHMVITSYQLFVQDIKYFQRIKWHYVVLDETQAIKSSSSMRREILLSCNCRNRLLLTGTPIHNSMSELLSLLHFTMPTLFESLDEFKDWFSLDVENRAENNTVVDSDHLSRLHKILKPFILRRIKKDVESELHDKVEILTYCPLTRRQGQLYRSIKHKISMHDLSNTVSRLASPNQSQAGGLMNLVVQLKKVCNHPELFEHRQIFSGLYYTPIPYFLPRLLYRDCLLDDSIIWAARRHILHNRLNIYDPHNIHQSYQASNGSNSVISCFSFLRFIDTSPMEMYKTTHTVSRPFYRWSSILMGWKSSCTIHHLHNWPSDLYSFNSYLHRNLLVISPLTYTSACNVATSSVLRHVIFTSHVMTSQGHADHLIKSTLETRWHRRIRLRGIVSPVPVRSRPVSSSTSMPVSPHKGRIGRHSSRSATSSPTKVLRSTEALLSSCSSNSGISGISGISNHKPRPDIHRPCILSDWPAFVYYHVPRVRFTEREIYCGDRSAAYDSHHQQPSHSLPTRSALFRGFDEFCELAEKTSGYISYRQTGRLRLALPGHGFSGILIPDRESLVSGAGKLRVLDRLLTRLKAGGHRVLIYSQMTRMTDILEEFLWYRHHSYMRLDGFSKLSEQRDITDSQNRSDIFVFLLSTRIGGLDISLAAADTVIFYDSDLNPTVDQQAMDRAHRLSQTKQVTVYRLVCEATIEERILHRAMEKVEMQRGMTSGGMVKSDSIKPCEVVSLLLDDDEVYRKFLQEDKEPGAVEDGNSKRKVKYRDRKRQLAERLESVATTSLSGAGDSESVISFESGATSPISVGSESISFQFNNDSSNDALADDTSSVVSGPSPKRCRGRPPSSIKSTSDSAMSRGMH